MGQPYHSETEVNVLLKLLHYKSECKSLYKVIGYDTITELL